MNYFPWKKLGVIYSALFVLVLFLKCAVDSCIPNGPSPVFPPILRAVPAVCDALLPWVVWSKTQQARVLAQQNFFNEGPTALEDDDGKPSMVLFSDAFMKLPELLGKVPKDTDVLLQILFMFLVVAVLVALVWEWGVSLAVGDPKLPQAPQGFIPKGQAATEGILPDYLKSPRDSKSESKKEPRKDLTSSD